MTVLQLPLPSLLKNYCWRALTLLKESYVAQDDTLSKEGIGERHRKKSLTRNYNTEYAK